MSLSDLLAMLPILILAFGATAILMAGAWYREPLPLLAGGIVTALLGALSAGLVTPPIPEIAGLFSAGGYARFYTIVWSLLAAAGLMTGSRYIIEKRIGAGEYVSLVLYAAAGMALLSSATHLVGLFIALETFTLAFYILIASNRNCALAAEAGLKYLLLGAVATGFMAFGIALIYAASGSLVLPDAVMRLTAETGELQAWGLLGWGMILIAVGFKISLAPFHLWTPDVYQGAPAPVTGLLATGSKGAVVAALVGLLAMSGPVWNDLTDLVWLLAALTMLAGAFGALGQSNLKRLLAYSSVTHMGTLLVGVLCQTSEGFAATTFYVVVYVVTSLGAFAVIASLADGRGEPMTFDQWRGLGYRHPVRCGVMVLLLLSLAGLPATAGFMAKFAVFHAALQSGYIGLLMIGILASVISFAFYLRVTMLLFQPDEQASSWHQGSVFEHTVLAVCSSAVLVLGLFPGLLFGLIRQLLP
ncbi:MAG: NADH-quinone oxidoreductase subunit N [Desulfuromonadales bacterium]